MSSGTEANQGLTTREAMKVTVLDVAECVLQKLGAVPAMKLQKLVYYCQAWSLVWEDRTIYDDRIEAWAHGPVIPRLYAAHRGEYMMETVSGNPSRLSQEDAETIEAVVKFYGDKSSQWLSDLTHQEYPWKKARKGLQRGERGSKEITLASMAEYYGSL